MRFLLATDTEMVKSILKEMEVLDTITDTEMVKSILKEMEVFLRKWKYS